MSDTDHQTRLQQQLRTALDDHTAQLDPRLLERLDAVRRQALAEAPRKPWQARLGNWFSDWRLRYSLAPAGGLITAALVAMLWWESPAPTPPGVQDFELLTAETSLELLEDLEFAEWLLFEDEEDSHVPG